MTSTRTSRRTAFALISWLVCATASVAAQDTLARAKELYSSAAYDEALAVLDRLQHEATGTVATEIAQYRAFCFLALDRNDEARKAIEGIVNADPFYHPSDADTSPRVRSVFEGVRRPLLPIIVQRWYAEARTAFDRKDAHAASQFERVIALLDDPDLKSASLSDLRTLASGFRDLSQAATAAAAAPPAPVVAAPSAPSIAPAVVSAVGPAAISAAVPARESDAGVKPPVTVSQPMPLWAPATLADRRGEFRGTLEVTIDERGDVEDVTLRQSVHPLYDRDLLKTARTWKFKPAMKDGLPVLYTKVVQIHLVPTK